MDPLDRLTSCLARLPGIGRRSALRMAMHIVREKDVLLKDLIDALRTVDERVCCCSLCGNVTLTDRVPCVLCTDPGRDDNILCVVEEPSDVLAIERSGGFHGRYHALMGKVSPMKGNGPDDLRISALVDRVAQGDFKEVVLALSTDMEGDSTASFVSDLLADKVPKITRLAFGLPSGSGIMYSDSVTLARAIRGRVSDIT